jgi:hypothetical protein
MNRLTTSLIFEQKHGRLCGFTATWFLPALLLLSFLTLNPLSIYVIRGEPLAALYKLGLVLLFDIVGLFLFIISLIVRKKHNIAFCVIRCGLTILLILPWTIGSFLSIRFLIAYDRISLKELFIPAEYSPPSIRPNQVVQITDASSSKLLLNSSKRIKLLECLDDFWKPIDAPQHIAISDRILANDYGFLSSSRDEPKLSKLNMPIVDWRFDRSERVNFGLHRQLYLISLVHAFHATGRVSYISKAKSLALDWISHNPSYIYWLRTNPYFQIRRKFYTEYPWNDDTTSNRLISQIVVFVECARLNILSDEETNIFLTSFARHGHLLATPQFYSSSTNHGLMQCQALLLLATVFPEFKASRLWKHLALFRAEDQMRNNVTADGISREFSPTYQEYILKKFLSIYLIAINDGINLSPEYIFRLKNMLRSAVCLRYPDGSLPRLGDSTGISVKTYPDKDVVHNQESSELLLEIKKTAKCNPGAHYWPDAGLYMWEAYSQLSDRNLAFLFYAGPWRTNHLHFDALTFELFFGKPLIVGPGYPDFDGAQATFICSTPAHNTIVVDNHSHLPGPAQFIGRPPNLLPQEKFSNPTIIRAYHKLYQGVTIYRNIIFWDTNVISIIDQIVSHEIHVYDQVFHFSPESGLRIKDGMVMIYDRNILTAQLQSKSINANGILEDCQARKAPSLFVGLEKYIRNPAVKFTQKSSDGCFVTFIILEPKPPGLDWKINGNIVELTLNGQIHSLEVLPSTIRLREDIVGNKVQ